MHTVYTQYAHIASVHTSPLPWLTGVVTPINCLSLSPGFQLYTPTETQTETFSAYPQYCGPSISLGPLRVLKSRHQSHGCVIEGPVDTEMLSSSASSSHQEQQFLLLAPAWNPSLMFLHGFLGQVHHDPPLAPPPPELFSDSVHIGNLCTWEEFLSLEALMNKGESWWLNMASFYFFGRGLEWGFFLQYSLEDPTVWSSRTHAAGQHKTSSLYTLHLLHAPTHWSGSPNKLPALEPWPSAVAFLQRPRVRYSPHTLSTVPLVFLLVADMVLTFGEKPGPRQVLLAVDCIADFYQDWSICFK